MGTISAIGRKPNPCRCRHDTFGLSFFLLTSQHICLEVTTLLGDIPPSDFVEHPSLMEILHHSVTSDRGLGSKSWVEVTWLPAETWKETSK